MVVEDGNGLLDRLAATPKQAVASDSVLRAHRDHLGGACVPVGGVRTVTDPSTSGVPLVHQSHGGVQNGRTIEVGATDAGATHCAGQVGTVLVGTGLGADCTSGYRGGNRRSWTAEPSPIASVGEEMEPHKREVKIG